MRRFRLKILERFAKPIADFAEKMTTYAGSAADPGEYGRLIAARLCPDTLPYELGTSAAFEVASFNGRALGDDVLDVLLTLAANTAIVDGLAPDRGRIRKDFRERYVNRRALLCRLSEGCKFPLVREPGSELIGGRGG
jgi:hypothetical protein